MKQRTQKQQENCLVVKARKRCKCKDCIEQRKFDSQILRGYVQYMAQKIWYDALMEATKTK